MRRRDFIKQGTVLGASIAARPGVAAPTQEKPKSDKLLNAYYFRAHMYTMVPRQVREDLQWMADLGTDVVSIAIIEQDLFAAVENVEIICQEAEKLGLAVHLVPSRWGGMVAGAPKVPSLFSAKHPQTWMLQADGTPYLSEVSGVISSVHYPETYEFFCTSLDQCFSLWNVQGIVWDEPKSFLVDYSPQALAALGPDVPVQAHWQAVVDFYGKVNAYVKERYPEQVISYFDQAHRSDERIALSAQIPHVDYFGCDGRPWYPQDGGQTEGEGKNLLGNGERFLKAARQQGKKTLWLVENHNMRSQDVALLEKHMPEILTKDVDQLIYYYFPRNLENPRDSMRIIAKNIARFK